MIFVRESTYIMRKCGQPLGNVWQNWQLLGNFSEKVATLKQLFTRIGATFDKTSSILCPGLVLDAKAFSEGSGARDPPLTLGAVAFM